MTSFAERYFRPKAFERDGRMYRWLGVALFKRALMSMVQVDPSKPTSNGYVLGGRTLEDLRAFDQRSRRSEVIHLAGLLLAVGFFVFTAIFGGLLIPGLIVFAVNFHCFALQRFNRARIHRVLGRRRG